MKRTLLLILLFSFSIVTYSQKKTIENLNAAPNPFSNSTTILFSASKSNSTIIFKVKNILGKTVYTKTIKTTAGKNKIPFEKGNLKSGMYIYSLQSNDKIISKRLVIK